MGKKKILRTEKGKAIMELFDLSCPGEERMLRPVLGEKEIYEELNAVRESIGLWGAMISDDIYRLSFVPREDAAHLKEDIAMCRAHLQECKVLERELRKDLEKLKSDLHIGEINDEREELTA